MEKTLEVLLESPVDKSFRCKLAADSLDIDVNKKSRHHLKIENVNVPENWDLGVICGASGSGKTTLAKQMFGGDLAGAGWLQCSDKHVWRSLHVPVLLRSGRTAIYT